MTLSQSIFLLIVTIPFAASAKGTDLTPLEQNEIEGRIHRFYSNRLDAATMNQRTPKFSVNRSVEAHPNTFLKLKSDANTNPLLELAQAKATDSFRKHQCKVYEKNFPTLTCDVNSIPATIEDGDKVEILASGWIEEKEIKRSLDEIPARGETSMPLWSDDYWKTRYGGLSYRYASKKDYETYDEAIKTYKEPSAWNKLVDKLSAKDLVKAIIDLSPAEKYDVAVGDSDFSLTNEQKNEGDKLRGDDGNVEEWMGICDGWSAASVMVPKPTKSAETKGIDGTTVTWYPADIRALASESWSRGAIKTNFVSNRCDTKHPQTYPNGRLKNQDCFDTNPATFHLALGNMIGRHSLSFVMDVAFDYEVWNQPVDSYQFTYFNPMNPGRKSKNWNEVAVDYSDSFKKTDRFQTPLTRGVRDGHGNWDDGKVKKIVGVIATVMYLVEEEPPQHKPELLEDNLTRVTYTYDLELEEENGLLVATGGEWHENTHPDFLWVPQKGSVPYSKNDDGSLVYEGKTPTKKLTSAAVKASDDGFPLCEVLGHLVKESSGHDLYRCEQSR